MTASLAIALLLLASFSVRAAQRSGLYKDGQLIQAFDDLDGVVAAQLGTAPAPSTPLGKSHAVASSARLNEVSPGTQSRNEAFARAARPVADLSLVLQRIELENRSVTPAERDQILQCLEMLRASEPELHATLEAVGQRLKQSGAHPAIHERQRESVLAITQGMKAVSDVLSEVVAGQDGAVRRAVGLLEHMKFRPEPSLEKAGPTVQMRVTPAPTLTREQADARLPQPVKTASLVAVRNLSPPTASDLAATPDVQITPAITNQAAALGNSPAAIYEWVRNQVAFQPYLGSRKGSAFTLRQRAGNDTDQASLLLALLRAAGVPCRYVRGTVELSPARAASWLGVADPHTAGAILTTAGLDGLTIVSGTNVLAIRCTRVWVEAHVPYSNYRGVPNDQTGKTWVPLDPAFKESVITDGVDALTGMGFNAQSYLANYISTFHPASPVEFLEQNVQSWLDVNQPGKTIADVGWSSTLAVQELGLLPASLPYDVLTVPSRFSELEDNKRFKVRFNLYNGGTTFINYTTNLTALAGHRVTIEWTGATTNDQAVIDAHGGIYETPPNLVSVKPLLKIDGAVAAASVNSIGAGYTPSSDMTFIQPVGDNNVQPTVNNSITAGNNQAIGFDTFLDVNDTLFDVGGSAPDSLLTGLLHTTALDYLGRVDRGQERMSRLLRMVTIQDVSEAIVESSVKVLYSFGVPVTFEWTGLIVDADRRIIGPFAVDGNSAKQTPFMLVSGYDGSTMENRVFEDTYGQQAVSTIKILELANDRGIHVCYITNNTAICPGLSQSFSIVSAINNALSRGHVVIIPERSITISNWSGTGYIDLDPASGAAGYIISGGISGNVTVSGGATVESWPVFLPCLNPVISNDPADPIRSYSTESPNSPTDVFSGGDSHHIKFKGKFKVLCPNKPVQSQSFSQTTSFSVSDIAATYGPGEYSLSLLTTIFLRLTIFDVKIDSVDANFAPGAEQLKVTYSVRPNGFAAPYAKIEAFKSSDTGNALFKNESVAKSGTMVVYDWDGKANQGADSGKFISPENSPFLIRAFVDTKATFANAAKDEKDTKVQVESMEFSVNAATKVIMNDPEHKEEISVLVKLKKKDGTGVATAVPVQVELSFSDPGDANTAKTDSYEYVGGKFLGKKNDAAAIHWEDHAKADSDSADGYKLVCRAKTIDTAGADQGKTFVWFKPSGVGADDFKLKAVLKQTDGSELKAVESGALAVWRQVRFDRIYEMNGETHVSVNATEAKIQPYFIPASVEYTAGAVNAIPVAKSVKYIGLWKNTAPYQEDWATIQTKLPAETPTAGELTAAEGPAGAARDAARVAITAKAQTWVNRIDSAFFASLAAWEANGGIANNSLIAIKYYHPKYSSGGGDSATAEWPAWVTVTTYGGSYPGRDPDGPWPSGGGDFGGLSHGNGIITIPKGFPAATVERDVAHEAGHATKSFFKRQDFGPSLDHSAAAGLMDLNGSQNAFTTGEKKILRGITP